MNVTVGSVKSFRSFVNWIKPTITSESRAVGSPRSSLPTTVSFPCWSSKTRVLIPGGTRSASVVMGNSARFISSRPTRRSSLFASLMGVPLSPKKLRNTTRSGGAQFFLQRFFGVRKPQVQSESDL